MVTCGAISSSRALRKLGERVPASWALREPGGCKQQRPRDPSLGEHCPGPCSKGELMLGDGKSNAGLTVL